MPPDRLRRLVASLAPLALLLGIATAPIAAAAQAPAGAAVRLVVKADLGRDTISRHLFGHFAEHLGRDIYDGFWTKQGTGTWHLRDDVIEALKRIRVPNLRWPGGCFADYYHWRDGIGDPAKRPKMVNTLWGNVVEDNSFGTHEFMELVRRLGAEPVVVGNVGSGSVREMADWWEYLNHPGGSSLADERAANGHREPFRVRWFGVGNESWGCGGAMRPEYYADLYRRHAEFLRSYERGRRPFRIATGPNVADYNWTEVMMRQAGGMIDGLDLHYYVVVGPWNKKGAATRFDEREWFDAMKKALRMDELITRHSAIMDRHDPQRRVALLVGEWGMWHDVEPGTEPGFLYQQNTMRDALVASSTLDVFASHVQRVRGANIAQTINVLQAMILTQGERMILTPTYHVFEMYVPHQDALRLPHAFVRSSHYAHAGDSIPAVSATASRGRDGAMHLTLSNLDPNAPRTVEVELRGATATRAEGRILVGRAMNAHNTFEQPDAVRPEPFTGARVANGRVTLTLPAHAIVALTLR